MEDAKVISDLSINIYHLFGKDSSYYDYALEVLRNSSHAICLSLDEMKIRLKNMFENKVEGNMGLE